MCLTMRRLLGHIVSLWSSYILWLTRGIVLLIRRWRGRLKVLLEMLVWGIVELWRGVRCYSGFPPS